jgi:hypothetical protein
VELIERQMSGKLILILGSCAVGCASAGLCGLCFLLTRPYRKARNRIVILLSSLFVAIAAVGGIFLVGEVAMLAGAARAARESASQAYLVGLLCVEFLVIRAEVRWRRSWLPVRPTGERPPNKPEAKRTLVIAFCIAGLSWVFAIAYLVNRTQPFAPILVGFSGMSLLASMTFLGRYADPSKIQEIRKGFVIVAVALICGAFLVAFQSRATAPNQTTAWIVSVSLLCIALLSARFLLKPKAQSAASE